MGPFDYDHFVFGVGDLVEFIGYHYTPDYYMIEEDQLSLGIVIELVGLQDTYAHNVWLYKVYWFKSKKITETVAGHLKLVKVEPNKRTNYIDGIQNED
tara:strand:+ start:639 stop:932 length:294 start_codon:yes stop_codon:yes gene_type:complete